MEERWWERPTCWICDYWWLLLIGHTLGIRLELPPAFAMWFPNLVVFMAATAMLTLRMRQ